MACTSTRGCEGAPERAIRIAAAYAFVERWLRHQKPPDNARRVTPFVDPYSESYVEELAQAFADGRAPDMGRFVELYAEYNPDRNRGLDMWPLIAHLAPKLARRFHEGPIKNARPTFHYRLPDSLVALPGWSPSRGLRALGGDRARRRRPRDLRAAAPRRRRVHRLADAAPALSTQVIESVLG